MKIEEKIPCRVKEKIYIKKISDCYSNTTGIFDSSNNLVFRIDFNEDNYLNIQAVFDKKGYCPYCFDGIKNYDEEEIDCGGSCSSCSKFEYNINHFIAFAISAVFSITFIYIFYLVIRTTWLSLRLNQIKNRFK